VPTGRPVVNRIKVGVKWPSPPDQPDDVVRAALGATSWVVSGLRGEAQTESEALTSMDSGAGEVSNPRPDGL
jgi:hypothetical protein